MARFVYDGFDTRGKPDTGEIEAPDERQAFQKLQALGVIVTELHDGAGGLPRVPWYKRDIRFGTGHMSLADQADLADQLAVLFRARLPLTEVMRIATSGASGRTSRLILSRAAKLVADGVPLAEAFVQAGGRASTAFLTLLRLSDSAPDAADLLRILASFLRRQARMRAQILGALLYPAILVCGAFAVLLLVSFILAPNIAPMFTSLDRPVPGVIALFVALGEWAARYGVLLAAGGVLGTGAVLAGWSAPAFASLRRRILLGLPLVGRLVRLGELSRLTRSLDLLLRSGLELPDALRQSAGSFGGGAVAPDFEAAAEALEHGGTASAVFDASRSLPGMFRELFRVGEEANTLPDVLATIAAALDAQLEQQTQRGLGLMTPLLTLILGGGIGLLIYAVMSAILSVNDLAF